MQHKQEHSCCQGVDKERDTQGEGDGFPPCLCVALYNRRRTDRGLSFPEGTGGFSSSPFLVFRSFPVREGWEGLPLFTTSTRALLLLPFLVPKDRQRERHTRGGRYLPFLLVSELLQQKKSRHSSSPFLVFRSFPCERGTGRFPSLYNINKDIPVVVLLCPKG